MCCLINLYQNHPLAKKGSHRPLIGLSSSIPIAAATHPFLGALFLQEDDRPSFPQKNQGCRMINKEISD